MRVIVNATNAMYAYMDYLSKEVLFTDIEQDVANAKDISATLEETLDLARSFPGSTFGMYISSRDVRVEDTKDFFPYRAVSNDGFIWSDYIENVQNPGYRIADYSQHHVRNLMVKKITEEAIRRKSVYGTNLVYTDNWSYLPDKNDYGLPGWNATLLYMLQLKDALHNAGILLATNIAIVPGDTNADSGLFDYLPCDAVTLEEYAVAGFDRPEFLTRWVSDYQALIKQGITVIPLPSGIFSNIENPDGVQKIIAEADFCAGFCYCLYGPLVGHAFWVPRQRWHRWYAEIGAPKGPLEISGTTIQREFLRYRISVDMVARKNTLTKKPV